MTEVSSNDQSKPLIVRYTNYRGEVSVRRIRPIRVYWGSNKWHPEPQWLMDVWDDDKHAARSMALKDIQPLDTSHHAS